MLARIVVSEGSVMNDKRCGEKGSDSLRTSLWSSRNLRVMSPSVSNERTDRAHTTDNLSGIGCRSYVLLNTPTIIRQFTLRDIEVLEENKTFETLQIRTLSGAICWDCLKTEESMVQMQVPLATVERATSWIDSITLVTRGLIFRSFNLLLLKWDAIIR
ncbi:uncharacterized protein LOC125501944 [Athalia rosae]|uniref:uncharacterized protein LOC125501944 n=1 Tax=Athalia rosae TaxID=37344 RepID=UPI002033ACBA|nr:uncharacterized protein LOC125501944 [Athalia rosae]